MYRLEIEKSKNLFTTLVPSMSRIKPLNLKSKQKFTDSTTPQYSTNNLKYISQFMIKQKAHKLLERRLSRNRSRDNVSALKSKFKIIKNSNKLRRVSQDPEIPKCVLDAAKPIIQTPYTNTSNSACHLQSLKSVTNLEFSKKMKTKIMRFAKKHAFCISKPKYESVLYDNLNNNKGFLHRSLNNEDNGKPKDYLKLPNQSDYAL